MFVFLGGPIFPTLSPPDLFMYVNLVTRAGGTVAK